MAKTRSERGVVCVNVEVEKEQLAWIDRVASEHESSRSGIMRLALRKFREKVTELERGMPK